MGGIVRDQALEVALEAARQAGQDLGDELGNLVVGVEATGGQILSLAPVEARLSSHPQNVSTQDGVVAEDLGDLWISCHGEPKAAVGVVEHGVGEDPLR